MKILFIITFIIAISTSSNPLLWCIHDLVKINPQTASAYEAGNLYTTKLPATYKEKNSVWDAKSETVTLRALRDEVVAIQIIVEDTIPFIIEKIEAKGFDKKIQSEIFIEWFMNVTEPSFNKYHWIFSQGKGWYPSHFIPVNAIDLKEVFSLPLKIPGNSNGIVNQKAAVVWIDLHITSEMKKGRHKGKINLIINGKKKSVKTIVNVDSHLIPQKNNSNFIAISQQARNVYVKAPEQVKELNHIFHAHRIDFVPYQWYMESEGKGKDFKISWDKHIYNDLPHLGSVNFDRDILPFLKGSAFTRSEGYYGPAQGVPPSWTILPLAVGWFTRKGITYPSQEYDESFIAACEQVAKKYTENGITQRKMTFIIKADEPKSMEELQIGKHHADLFDAGFTPHNFKYFYRMDGVGMNKWAIQHFDKVWSLDSVFALFNGKTHIWNQVANDFAFPLKDTTIDYLKNRYGGEYWLCHTNTTGEPGIGAYPIDCEAPGIISWPWILWKYRIDGGMFWEAFFDGAPESLWTEPLAQESSRKPKLAFVNGDGGMVYPGEFVLNTKRFLPGHKIKLIRRAQQDYEYLHLLTKLTGSRVKADSIASIVINKALWEAVPKELDDWDKHKKGEIDPEYNYMKGKWSHNPEEWYMARMAILDLLKDY